jgi:SNF2 family DNA or RNA helicase
MSDHADLLKRVRASKTVRLKQSRYMRSEIDGPTGKIPFQLRYYQVQGAFHLMTLKRMVLGDGTGLGKTCQVLAALGHLWEREPENKVLVVGPKSAVHQWAAEIERFMVGVKPTVATGTPTQRKELYAAFDEASSADEKQILIMSYGTLVRDWNAGSFQPVDDKGKPDKKKPVVPGLLDALTRKLSKTGLVVITDEAHAYKSKRTKTWEIVRYLFDRAHRGYALTATLMKNRLEEAFSIYSALLPKLLGTKTKFLDEFCHVTLQRVGTSRGKRYVPIVVGYKNLDTFRERIAPVYLGRTKHEVSSELPALITREVICRLTPAEETKYEEALSGVLELGDGEVKEFEETAVLTSLIYCQQVVNSLWLLKYGEGDELGTEIDITPAGPKRKKISVSALGSKETALLDLVEGEFADEKVIVYTRFASLVPRLVAILEKAKVPTFAITGKHTAKARRNAQVAFQEAERGVIFITSAGSEAINLQTASVEIFYDLPWSFGEFCQVIGRMIRIGSPHRGVQAIFLVSERSDTSEKTIDRHVLSLLNEKRTLIDRVLGEAAVGALDVKSESAARQLIEQIRKSKASV